ncbi:helix-turn-helix domain-containing protein [Streptobacillus moniliformis]|uniref:helix-turn-helix domain-containing protein n=1 Tax=Streptobacillus moniliformis TaxID=34105 RepID=UPI0007E32610|nr:helix-turn-helix transcriptional regulator [Streptobacillus moniliformis]
MDIAEKLKTERRRKKITLQHLSELTGIHISNLKSYENGHTKSIPIDKIIILSKIYEKDPNYFLLDSKKIIEDDNKNSLSTLDAIITINEALISKLTLLSEKDTKKYLALIEKFLINKI